MKHNLLSFVFLSAVTLTIPRVGAADPAVPASVEAADKQFLANLEKKEEVQRVEPKPVAPVTASVTPREPKIASTMKKPLEHFLPLKRDPAPKKVEAVEVRRAIPVVATTGPTIVKVEHRDHDDDEEDNDGDHDGDNGNGFFHRLFRGEKIFR